MMLNKSLEHKPSGKLRLPLRIFQNARWPPRLTDFDNLRVVLYGFGHARVIKHSPESLQGQLQGHFNRANLF